MITTTPVNTVRGRVENNFNEGSSKYLKNCTISRYFQELPIWQILPIPKYKLSSGGSSKVVA